MLRKRFVIETVLDTLKSEMGLEHSRHRSPVNAMVHVLSYIAKPISIAGFIKVVEHHLPGAK